MTTNYGSISFLIGFVWTWFFSGQFQTLPLSVRAIICGIGIMVYLLIFHRRTILAPSVIPQTTMGATFIPMPQPTTAATAPSQLYVPPTYQPVQPVAQPNGMAGMVSVATPEQKVINTFFFQRGIAIQAVASNPTPDYDCYTLSKLDTVSWSVLTDKIKDDLRVVIYEYRYKTQRNTTLPVTVGFDVMPPLLRVSRAQREFLTWDSRPRGLPMGTAQFGAYMVGGELHPVMLNTYNAKEWYGGIFSSSGGGKSTLLHAAALSLLEASDPAKEEFYFIDLDSNQFEVYAQLPMVKAIASTEEQALSVLNYLVTLMENNYDLSNTVRRYLIVDEVQIMTEESDQAEVFTSLFGTLAQRWRKHGGSMFLATQDPTGDNYPRPLRRNLKATFAGSIEDDSYINKYLHLKGACSLQGDGDFIVKRVGGTPYNFKGFYLTREDIANNVQMLTQRFGSEPTLYDLSGYLPKNAATEPVDTSGLPAMANSKGDVNRQQAAAIEMICQYVDDHEALPTAWAVRTWYKNTFNVTMNANTASRLLEQAKAQLAGEGDEDEA